MTPSLVDFGVVVLIGIAAVNEADDAPEQSSVEREMVSHHLALRTHNANRGIS
jgi:hypothetical protein